MDSILDALDLFGGLGGLGGVGGALSGVTTFAKVIGTILKALTTLGGIWLALMAIIVYVFYSFTLMLVGKKAGRDRDWMPFVPVARTLYRLQIIGEHWWKVFFLDPVAIVVCSLLISWLFNFIHGTFALIMVILYLLSCFAYYIYYMFHYFKAFGLHPSLILALFTILGPGVSLTVDVLIGYSNLFAFGDRYGMAPARGPGLAPPPPAPGAPMRGAQQQAAPGFQSAPPSSAPAPGFQAAPTPPPAAGFTGSITCLSGMYSGNSFNLVANEEMTIGRDATVCNIVLDQGADKVSRKHCGILYNPATRNYYVTDYSSNGTLTREGSRLVNNIPTQLPPGSVICLGNNENRFMLN